MADALKGARDTLGLAIDGCSPEHLRHEPGGTANTIASVYVHALKDEDDLMALVTGRPSLWNSGWKEKLGGTDEMGLVLDSVKGYQQLDLAAWAPYVEALGQTSDAAIRGMSDADLEKTVDMGEVGQPTAKEIIRDYITWHHAFHSGEISSQKGVLGLQGVPF
jgi:hypothetical protein